MPTGIYNRPSVLQRFLKHTNKNGPIHPIHGQCWIWEGSLARGYGQFGGLGECKAHRVAYRLLVGDIPNDLFVLHKCDNRVCVNPSHLFLGTAQDNIDDCISKDRHNRGDRNGSRTHPESVPKGEDVRLSKLTEEQVKQIRSRYKPYNRIEGIAALAKEYGVGPKTIWSVIHRKTWKHLK